MDEREKKMTWQMSWQFYAFAAAGFAALTAILSKAGVAHVDSNLATAIRTVVILVFAWAIVFAQGTYKVLPSLDKRTVWLLIFSGLATGLSWLCYFRALQMAPASRVAPIDKLSLVFTIILAGLLLHEKIDAKMVLGAVLMTIGSLLFLK